jgi:hypothetical protein
MTKLAKDGVVCGDRISVVSGVKDTEGRPRFPFRASA